MWRFVGMCFALGVWLVPPSTAQELAELSSDLAEIVNQTGPSVIHLRTEQRPLPIEVQRVLRAHDVYELLGTSTRPGGGSGVIVDPSGIVLTNHHLVSGAVRIEAEVDGQAREVQWRGSDPDLDLAVLELPSQRLWPHVQLRTEPARIGELALALGYPKGGPLTATLGMISRIGLEALPGHRTEHSLIVSDAMIDRGNSGGALLDVQGRMLGINVAASDRGLTYTIPSEQVQHVLQTVRIGHSSAYLGAIVASIIGVDDDPSRRGIAVRHLEPGSPAETAGLQAGDVIIALNGTRTETTRQLAEALRITPAHQPAELTINRDHMDTPLQVLPSDGPLRRPTTIDDGTVVAPGGLRTLGWTTGDHVNHTDQPVVTLTRGEQRFFAVYPPNR